MCVAGSATATMTPPADLGHDHDQKIETPATVYAGTEMVTV